ncbi:hypothetical protein EES41_39915 (plasmid) [Streptomyces sp. ADI95-16]|nr:hypothetical protein EES41_39915 [Streptomyces sp. ADI95-16]
MELPEKRLSMRGLHQLEVHVLAMEQLLPGNLHDIILTRLSVIGSTRRIYRSHALILPPRAPTELCPSQFLQGDLRIGPVHLRQGLDRP